MSSIVSLHVFLIVSFQAFSDDLCTISIYPHSNSILLFTYSQSFTIECDTEHRHADTTFSGQMYLVMNLTDLAHVGAVCRAHVTRKSGFPCCDSPLSVSSCASQNRPRIILVNDDDRLMRPKRCDKYSSRNMNIKSMLKLWWYNNYCLILYQRGMGLLPVCA